MLANQLSVLVTLPLPPHALHPNARPHFMSKAKATKRYRYCAEMKAREATGNTGPMWRFAAVRCTFYFRDRRKRDADNLLAQMKSAMDGLADAGIVANDHGLRHEPVEIKVDKASPRVEVQVWELTK